MAGKSPKNWGRPNVQYVRSTKMNDCVGSQKSPQKLFYRTKKDIAAKPVGRVFPLDRGRLFWGQCRTAGLRRPKRSVKNFWIVSWISPSGNHSRGTNSTCHSRSRPVSTNKISRNCSRGSRSSSRSSAHFDHGSVLRRLRQIFLQNWEQEAGM